MLTNILKTLHITERFFRTQLPSQWSIIMVKVAWFRLQQCLVPLTCYLSKGRMRGEFLEIWLTTFFGVLDFGNTSAMRVTSFWECSQFNLHFKNVEKNSENVSFSEISFIGNGCLKLSLLRGEHLSSAVNILTNIINTLHITKGFFPTEFPSQWWINLVKVVCFRFLQCLVSLTCCLSKGSLKPNFLEIFSSTFFGLRNFWKYFSSEGHLFFENVENLTIVSKMQKQIEKMLSVCEIIAS